MELITRVFPGSEVKTQGSSSLGQVIIKHNSTTVIAVKQRDLFSKYRWPAAPKILERLEMLKEDLEKEMATAKKAEAKSATDYAKTRKAMWCALEYKWPVFKII